MYIQNMEDYNEYHMPRKASDATGHKTVVVVVVVNCMPCGSTRKGAVSHRWI